MILGLAVASTFPAHANWPEFRGPSGDGTAHNANLPTEWSRQQNVLWRAKLPGEGWSSPVVIGNKIYLTAAVPQSTADPNSGFDLVLLIVNADSGERLRQVTLFHEGSDAPRIHLKNSRSSATPVFDGKRLYVHFGHLGTACASLVGFENKVALVSDDGIASCYDAETGKRQWIERIGGNFSASPLLAGNRLYLFSEDGVGTVLGVSGTPSEIAVNDLGERTLASPAAIDDDLLIRTTEALYRIGR